MMEATVKKDLNVIIIIPTPFNSRGEIDKTALRLHLKRILPANPIVMVGGPGGGEISSLTPEEHDELLAITLEECHGRAPVRTLGFEPRTTREMVAFIQRAEKQKPDACLIYALDPGHSAVPTNTESERYFSTVIEQTSVPVTLSSHSRTGHQVSPAVIEALVNRYPQRVKGVQWGGPDVLGLAEVIRRVGDRVEVHCAGALNAAATLCLGGNGYMGGEGNFAPMVAASVISSFRAGDMEAFRRSFGLFMAITQLLIKGGASFRGKAMFDAFGLPGGGPHREPRIGFDASVIDPLVAQMAALNVPGLPPPASSERRAACAAGRGFES
jgi:4-hydroxy-tetrahydrodipicolinate synthase